MAAAGVRRAGARFRFRARDTRAGGGADGYYYFLGGGGDGFPRILLEEAASAPGPAVDAPATAGREAPPAAANSGGAAASAMAARITPAVLFVTVVLAVVLLVSGLLHVLRRLFLKRHHASAGAGERQLQHLFFPGHEDGAGSGGGGLTQAAIDALPEFAYAELAAASSSSSSRKGKETAARPFDCAVCLCEFAARDRLRLLPACGHAFHVACIDVWLRSSATCPLCRTKTSGARHLAADAPPADAEEQDKQAEQQDQAPVPGEAAAAAAGSSSVVLPVRLGRFTATDGGAEASTSDTIRIDARRCYSMGSYQYVLADEHLLVSVHMRHSGNAGGAAGTSAGGVATSSSSGDGHQQQGKKVFARGDSFSVSKIWQWRGSRRLPASLCADDGLPWAPAAKDPAAATRPQQQQGDT